ncbi:hypothetical protein GF325_06260 [Candidatus Bathyarchaeota archaeon]|nr:hypothetical protein [Candidatus Bathyarchaeota archaeon]
MEQYQDFLLVMTLLAIAAAVGTFSIKHFKVYYIPVAFLATLTIIVLYISKPPGIPDGMASIVDFIEFDTLILMFSMEIITRIAEKERVFQYLAIKLVRASKANPRVLFYAMNLVAAFFASIISGVMVAIIFMPLVIRVVMVLDMDPAPFLFGLLFSINLGCLLTPVKNIIISTTAASVVTGGEGTLTILFYLQHVWLFFFIAWGVTMIILDATMIRNHVVVPDSTIRTILEILSGRIVMDKEHRKRFYSLLVLTISMFIAINLTSSAALVALACAMILTISSKTKFKRILKSVEWEFLMYTATMFILVGILGKLEFIEVISSGLASLTGGKPLVGVLMLYLISFAFSSFLTSGTVSLLFVPIVTTMAASGQFSSVPVPLLVGLILSTNLGGNITPYGSSFTLLVLEKIETQVIDGFSFKAIFKLDVKLGTLQFLMGFTFLVLTSL